LNIQTHTNTFAFIYIIIIEDVLLHFVVEAHFQDGSYGRTRYAEHTTITGALLNPTEDTAELVSGYFDRQLPLVAGDESCSPCW
jgi:hypothetical protein